MEAGCKNAVAAEMRSIRVALFCSFAMVLASPRARGCRPALLLGRAAGTTFPRKGRSLC